MKNVTKAGGKQEMAGKGDRDGGLCSWPCSLPLPRLVFSLLREQEVWPWGPCHPQHPGDLGAMAGPGWHVQGLWGGGSLGCQEWGHGGDNCPGRDLGVTTVWVWGATCR